MGPNEANPSTGTIAIPRLRVRSARAPLGMTKEIDT